ncbi:MAG: M23 family metallopeptidase [Thermodesulfobacteriota bacterium]
MGKKRSLKKYVGFLLVVAVAGLAGLYVWNAEGERPTLSGLPEQARLSPDTSIGLDIKDVKSGLQSVRVTVTQSGQQHVLAKEEFDRPVHNWDGEFTLAEVGLSDGPVRVKVEARDRSWRNWLQGNLMQQSVAYEFDSKPPRISLESFQHNVRRGGSGVVAFQVSEPVRRVGVQIKDYFFPAYPQAENFYVCFFSFPFTLQPGEAQLLVVAEDQAGNVNQAGFHHYINKASFEQVKLPVTDRFLQTTIVNFQDRFPDQGSLLDVFLKVNRDLRKENRDWLKEIGRDTASSPLWSGRFLRQPNAARRAHFGTQRKYVYHGEVIDEQTHLGVDLASIARAEVPAANSGRVVFSDWMGIYGQVVVVDHGLGLQSLYAHLSQLRVQKGDRVDKGQIIGRTGTTGLAGGDHLHFGMLISGVPVNPVEWWDTSWIANNISPKLSLIKE